MPNLTYFSPNEELTFDYAMTDDELYEMPCQCGTTSCRQVITGFDWQKPEVQKKYHGYFSWFIQRKINMPMYGVE